MIRTTHGLLDEATLAKTVGFEDRPKEFVVWVEWRLRGHAATGCATCSTPGNPQPVDGVVLVRRDAHVILKEPTVTADALVGSAPAASSGDVTVSLTGVEAKGEAADLA